MAKRLSDLERKEIKRLYNKGLSILNISYELNRNKNTIKKYVKEMGLVRENPDLIGQVFGKLTVIELDQESSEESIFKDFLKAEIIRDDTYKTRVFIDIAQMYIDVGFEKMDKKEAAIRTLECMLDTTSNMDINKFIDLSGIDRAIKVTLEKYDIYDSFNIDKNVVEKEFKVRSIKTDTGFVIKNKFNAFRDSSKYRIVNNPDGTTDLLIKNIQYFKEG